MIVPLDLSNSTEPDKLRTLDGEHANKEYKGGGGDGGVEQESIAWHI